MSVISPPPWEFGRSSLRVVKLWKVGVLALAVSFVSWMSAMWMLCFMSKLFSSVDLLRIPLVLI